MEEAILIFIQKFFYMKRINLKKYLEHLVVKITDKYADQRHMLSLFDY